MAILLALTLAAATAPQSPASTQPLAPSTDAIIVEGRDIRRATQDYVDRVLPTTNVGAQFGRFEDPICPKAVGLDDALAKEVTDRVRVVAKTINVGAAGESCSPNLFVIVTPDKKAMIAMLRKSRPLYVKGVGFDELRRLGDSPRPYIAWQLTDVLAADGMPVPEEDNLPNGYNGASDAKGARVDANFAHLTTTLPPSRLHNDTKPRVYATVVIVETRALRNVTTRQLADFALLRSMLPIGDRDTDAPKSSILSLFDPGVTPEAGPQSLTWWDVAFVKSLVSTRSDTYASTQKNEIEHQMARELERGK